MGKPTGIVFFPAFDWAISDTHPERQERLLYTRDQLFEEGILDLPSLREYRAAIADINHVHRTHICIPDTTKHVTDAHLIAAGSCLKLADALFQGEIKNGFALVRPPGHHAMWVVHGNRGFCNINNEAIMIDYIRKKYGIKKVAVIDTDVHHGDGTQDIYFHDPNVLVVSFHQDPAVTYPGTGFIEDLGGPTAFATTLNVPLPPGTTDEGVMMVLDELILPILQDFQPELIINSAGQDNHFSDPLANLNMTAQGYARLNEKLSPHLAVLEGGYSVEAALPHVNLAITLAMAGLDYSGVIEPDLRNFSQPSHITSYIKDTVTTLRQVWQDRKRVNLDRIFGRGDLYTRNRRIFYDTDNIRDEQWETVYRCKECAGYLKTVSRAQHPDYNNYYTFALKTPIICCPSCLRKALQDFEEAGSCREYTHLYWQNQTEGKFTVVNRRGDIDTLNI